MEEALVRFLIQAAQSSPAVVALGFYFYTRLQKMEFRFNEKIAELEKEIKHANDLLLTISLAQGREK
ncbi:MAG: hypothetical protein A3G34_15175 [Candidatus Lindowbacteria bacterium RIFCSPLOWO2_12_FULL_62_27]|nr:MAG: hypothetical protein A3G34_15175 [Candidatus Lindowbacteria bacterium RIFCSPLOWO2_12_FULL_62_27]OGH63866.1 MAG: hypothetical protein A3I06_06155 [Candidatus Lindowbacteria bacterium RIFCSPLOWO2_02_FULL_62_12]